MFQTRCKAIRHVDILHELKNKPEYNLLIIDANEDEIEKNNAVADDQFDGTLGSQSQFPKWYHTSIWLNCVINGGNIFYYLLGIIFTGFGLLSGINLSVTTICRNIVLFQIFKINVLAPYSCHDAFNHFQ